MSSRLSMCQLKAAYCRSKQVGICQICMASSPKAQSKPFKLHACAPNLLVPWGPRPIHNATHPHHLRLGPPALQQPLCQQICCQIAGGNQQQPRLWQQPQHLHNHHGRISQRPSTSMKDNCQICKFCKPLTALRKGCRIRQYS